MAEAENLLKQVVAARKAEARTKKNQAEAKRRPHGEGITKHMHRTERKAHRLLIDLLLTHGKNDAAKAAAADYARQHSGHPSVAAFEKKGLIETQAND